jgi:long-chain acyl-CoA synthetase
LTDVSETFHQNEILLTGSNGFLGKVILGLLLDRYPRLKHLHLLLRPGLEASASKRFEKDVLESPALAAVADRLGPRAIESRITVWQGDISRENCGLGAGDVEKLGGRVRLIINCAGKVDFLPPLDESFSSNVDGVEHVVALAKSLGAKLVHISTSFVSGEADGLIEESEPILGFYPRRRSPQDQSFDHRHEMDSCREQIRLIYDSTGGAKHSKELRERLIALGRRRAEHWGWVNTYTYTKSLGEQIIASESDLDAAIVRPAIVESALRFPFPGWIEGGRTAAPLVLMALGGMKHWPVRRDTPLEVVPVDLVAAAVLVVAAAVLSGRHERVYQLGTADVHPIRLGPLVDLLVRESQRRGRGTGGAGLAFRWFGPASPARIVTAAEMRRRRERFERRIRKIQSVLDGMNRMARTARLPGRRSLFQLASKLRRIELQSKFREQTLDQYLPFILHNRYIFESENIRAAYAETAPRDRQLLPWDPERINWRKYWVDQQIEGIEKWVQPEAVKDWAFKI